MMMQKQSILTWAISILFALFAISLVIQLVDEAGPPILLDPDHKLEMPPPPKSKYQMGREAQMPPPTPSDSKNKNP